MRLKLQIILRYLKAQNKTLKMTTFLSSLGVVLGVCSLVLTMSVVSGVQKLIQDSIVDLTGHIMVLYRGDHFSVEELEEKLKKSTSEFRALTPFISTQGVVVNKSELLGIVIHGIEEKTAFNVISPQKRIVKGQMSLGQQEGVYKAMIGKEIAKRLKLNIGDMFNVVVPKPSQEKIQSFSPVVQKFYLSGVIDFGKFDYNEKVILTSDNAVQNLLGVGAEYVGAYVKLSSAELAPVLNKKISVDLGTEYKVRDWRELNQNFFSAVELEKVVIFIVVLFIVIVASFNISSTIFVSVLRKYSDISILKTLGASKKFLTKLFVYQGLLMGITSSVVGIAMGITLSMVIKYTDLVEVPGDVYKFDHLPVEIRWADITTIFFVTVGICFLSSILPAKKGAELKPVEGLKYE